MEASPLMEESESRAASTATMAETTSETSPTINQLNSIQILKNSSMAIFTSNFRFTLLLILSQIPYYSVMFVYELKLHKLFAELPVPSYPFHHHNDLIYTYQNFFTDPIRSFDLLRIALFHFACYPLLKTLTIIVPIKLAEKREKSTTFRDLLTQRTAIVGPLITCVYVQLLSTLCFLGFFWVVTNQFIFSKPLMLDYYYFWVFPMAVHIVLFIALMIKYLDWSAFWNVGLVISVLGRESGVGAFGMAAYYRRHCKKTGFYLMMVLCLYEGVLRLGCFEYVGMWRRDDFVMTAIVVGLVCMGNLVKWVAFVGYFEECKKKTMEKKVDEEMGTN